MCYIGVQAGRRRPLVLLGDWGERRVLHVHVGADAPDELDRPGLVRAVVVGVEEAHGDGLRPRLDELLGRGAYRVLVQRQRLAALAVDALRDTHPKTTGDDGALQVWSLPVGVVEALPELAV